MEKTPRNEPQQDVKNADYFVWRVMHARKADHDKRVRHLYNMRARDRYTKH